jgi:hypothetical protein
VSHLRGRLQRYNQIKTCSKLLQAPGLSSSPLFPKRQYSSCIQTVAVQSSQRFCLIPILIYNADPSSSKPRTPSIFFSNPVRCLFTPSHAYLVHLGSSTSTVPIEQHTSCHRPSEDHCVHGEKPNQRLVICHVWTAPGHEEVTYSVLVLKTFLPRSPALHACCAIGMGRTELVNCRVAVRNIVRSCVARSMLDMVVRLWGDGRGIECSVVKCMVCFGEWLSCLLGLSWVGGMRYECLLCNFGCLM